MVETQNSRSQYEEPKKDVFLLGKNKKENLELGRIILERKGEISILPLEFQIKHIVFLE